MTPKAPQELSEETFDMRQGGKHLCLSEEQLLMNDSFEQNKLFDIFESISRLDL
jgi:hypothetical protein